jgi:hypothetical protein
MYGFSDKKVKKKFLVNKKIQNKSHISVDSNKHTQCYSFWDENNKTAYGDLQHRNHPCQDHNYAQKD